MLSLSWRKYVTGPGTVDAAYVTRKRAELAALRAAGFGVILSLGYHDTPGWILALPDSRYVNQYGEAYGGGGEQDLGDANLVFNPVLREYLAAYVARVFADLGTNFAAVRVGGGRYGELTYPPAKLLGHANNYWAFDSHARAGDPVPGWRPGDASPNGESGRFLDWYLDALADYQSLADRDRPSLVRGQDHGPLPVLGHPARSGRARGRGQSRGHHVGGAQRRDPARISTSRGRSAPSLIAGSSSRRPGSTRTGLVTEGADPRYWSPVHFLASLAAANPVRPALYGENTGHGSAAALAFTRAQAGGTGCSGSPGTARPSCSPAPMPPWVTIAGGDPRPLRRPGSVRRALSRRRSFARHGPGARAAPSARGLGLLGSQKSARMASRSTRPLPTALTWMTCFTLLPDVSDRT